MQRFSMPSETIESVGRLLYGRLWRRPLAHDLGVSDMTIRRWRLGECKVPDKAIHEMGELLLARRQLLADMHQSLPRAAA